MHVYAASLICFLHLTLLMKFVEHNFDEAQKENAVDKCSKKISEDGDILKDSIGQPESNGKLYLLAFSFNL